MSNLYIILAVLLLIIINRLTENAEAESDSILFGMPLKARDSRTTGPAQPGEGAGDG